MGRCPRPCRIFNNILDLCPLQSISPRSYNKKCHHILPYIPCYTKLSMVASQWLEERLALFSVLSSCELVQVVRLSCLIYKIKEDYTGEIWSWQLASLIERPHTFSHVSIIKSLRNTTEYNFFKGAIILPTALKQERKQKCM